MVSTITLQDVYRELQKLHREMVSKKDLQQALETLSIAQNAETMRQLHESEADISKGKTKPVRNVKDLLSELV